MRVGNHIPVRERFRTYCELKHRLSDRGYTLNHYREDGKDGFYIVRAGEPEEPKAGQVFFSLAAVEDLFMEIRRLEKEKSGRLEKNVMDRILEVLH